MSKWFEADKDGLRQIAERLVEKRGFGIIGAELYQNVMDTNAKNCEITIVKTAGRPTAELIVKDDDPEGFRDLSHAWTLFAPSFKKADPTKAGRFNLGEKYVLSFCREAKIITTCGTVAFTPEGRQEYPRRKTEVGTQFWAIIDCTNERLEQLVQHMHTLIVKPGLTLTINGEEVQHRKPFKSFTAKLPTEIAKEDGSLSRTIRVCEVDLYEPATGDGGRLYELGIPVVETGDKWDYDVRQKVPLNTERDNVTPAYLRDLRTFVFNEAHNLLGAEDTELAWVNEAASDEKVTPVAIEDFRVKKFGDKSVAEDPFNKEANAEAMAHGYTVIPKHGLTPGQRDNLKANNFLLSSSAAFPTAGKGVYSDDPNAKPAEIIPEDQWTDGMRIVHRYTDGLARHLLSKAVKVIFVNVPRQQCGLEPWSACYGRGPALNKSEFHYNIGVLGRKWFDQGVTEKVVELILHEFGHEFSGNHLSREYHDGLNKLAARMWRALMDDPEWHKQFTPYYNNV